MQVQVPLPRTRSPRPLVCPLPIPPSKELTTIFLTNSQPEDDILGDASVLLAEEFEDLLLGVTERPVHTHKRHLREGRDEGMQLPIT